MFVTGDMSVWVHVACLCQAVSLSGDMFVCMCHVMGLSVSSDVSVCVK